MQENDLHESNSLIAFTESALKAAQTLQSENPDWRTLPLRVYIAGKGCDGFTYGVAFDDRSETDVEVLATPFHAVIDKISAGYMKGTVVDWVDDERGKGFVVTNPLQKKFRGKFFRRPNWQEKVEKI